MHVRDSYVGARIDAETAEMWEQVLTRLGVTATSMLNASIAQVVDAYIANDWRPLEDWASELGMRDYLQQILPEVRALDAQHQLGIEWMSPVDRRTASPDGGDRRGRRPEPK